MQKAYLLLKPAQDGNDKREGKKRKRKVRSELELYLKKFGKVCSTFEQVNEMYELLKQFESFLQQYESDIPPDTLARLKGAARLTDATSDGMKASCKVLQYEIGHAAKSISSGVPSSLIIGGVIAAAAVVGIVVAISALAQVQIAIVNNGCISIPSPPVSNLPIVLEVYKNPISTGKQDFVKVLPITDLTIDAKTAGIIFLSIPSYNIQVPMQIVGNVTDVRFNGDNILGESRTSNLKERNSHELVITCR
jgi:hypothetical protein